MIGQADAPTLALWCQKTAITNELTSSRSRVATGTIARQLADGKLVRGALIWAARHPRDYDLLLALTHIDVSSTFVPKADDSVRQVLLTAIVYHWVTFLVFITDFPGLAPPPLPVDRWTRIWPCYNEADYPPLALLDGNELTRMSDSTH